jgi:hypothetical protein
MEQKFRPKLLVANPFFSLKIGPLTTSIDVKTGFQILRILPLLSFYFPDCSNSRNGWGNRWHIAVVTAQLAKGLCLICHSRWIFADFTVIRPDLAVAARYTNGCPNIAQIANTRQRITES